MHRDPVQAVASRIVLTGELVEGLTGKVDWAEQARMQLAMCRAGFKNTLENPRVMDSRIHHVRYPDFVADPVGIDLRLLREIQRAVRSRTRRPPCAII